MRRGRLARASITAAVCAWSCGRLERVIAGAGLVALASWCQVAAAPWTPDRDHAVIERFLAREEVSVESYHARRHIEVTNARFAARGWMDVETSLTAAGAFSWSVLDEGGSKYIRHRVIRKALEMEAAAVAAGDPRRASITTANYVLSADGGDEEGAVVRLTARRPDPLLVNGAMRVDATGDLLEVHGRLAKSPSWWTTSVDVTRRYSRIDGIRVAVSTDVTSRVRVAGVSTMAVRYVYLSINGRTVAARPDSPDPPSRQEEVREAEEEEAAQGVGDEGQQHARTLGRIAAR